MIDIVDRLSFDANRCEASFSKGVASNIEEGIAEIKRLRIQVEKAGSLTKAANRVIDAWRYAQVSNEPLIEALIELRDTLSSTTLE